MPSSQTSFCRPFLACPVKIFFIFNDFLDCSSLRLASYKLPIISVVVFFLYTASPQVKTSFEYKSRTSFLISL